jgi:predicted nucleic acid-binding protein
MKVVLLDASVMVALFDDAEKRHEHYAARIASHEATHTLATTWPCVAEASYLLSPRNHMALLYWLGKGGASVTNFGVDDLPQFLAWMKRYTGEHKSPMDLADASLVWLAGHLDTHVILTEDRRDFLRYRLPDGRAFEILA